MKNIRNILRLLATIIMVVAVGGVYGNDTTTTTTYTRGEVSAVDFRYQSGDWTLPRFDASRTTLSRFYIMGGVGVKAMSDSGAFATDKISQVNYHFGVGYRFTPVHSMEISTDYSDRWSISAGYYLNLNNLIAGGDYRSKFEVLWGASVDIAPDKHSTFKSTLINSVGGSTSFRILYNPLNCISVYVEPEISVVNSVSSSGYTFDTRPSINLGIAYYFNKPDDHVVNLFMPVLLKTNLLYDLAMTPNIGIELPFSDRYSFTANIMRGWWINRDENSFAWQLQAYDVGGRVWLGDREKRSKLTGWFAGAFFSAGFYDFQFDDTRGVQGDFYLITGLSGGYAMQLKGAWGLEAELGLGYLVSDFQKYTVVEEQYLVKSGLNMKFKSVMPVKASVALTYRLFNR